MAVTTTPNARAAAPARRLWAASPRRRRWLRREGDRGEDQRRSRGQPGRPRAARNQADGLKADEPSECRLHDEALGLEEQRERDRQCEGGQGAHVDGVAHGRHRPHSEGAEPDRVVPTLQLQEGKEAHDRNGHRDRPAVRAEGAGA